MASLLNKLKITILLSIIGIFLITSCSEKNGVYSDKYDNGQKRMEVTYKDGKLNGPYLIWHENGEQMLKINFKENILDGEFSAFYDNGQKSNINYFENGVSNAEVKMWNREGELLFTMEMENNQPLGENVFYYSNGNILSKVICKKDNELFESKLYSEEGTILYEGFITEQEKFDSTWVFRHGNGGVCLEGTFRNSVFYNKEDNLPYTGNLTLMYDSSNTFMTCNFVDGKISGKAETWYKNGEIFSIQNYIDGVMEGENIIYLYDRHKLVRPYKNGLKEGDEKLFDPQGNLLTINKYKDGVPTPSAEEQIAKMTEQFIANAEGLSKN